MQGKAWKEYSLITYSWPGEGRQGEVDGGIVRQDMGSLIKPEARTPIDPIYGLLSQ